MPSPPSSAAATTTTTTLATPAFVKPAAGRRGLPMWLLGSLASVVWEVVDITEMTTSSTAASRATIPIG